MRFPLDLPGLSRIFRIRGMDWIVGVASGLIVAGFLILAAADFSPGRFASGRVPIVPLSIIGAICGAFGWAGVHSWRRLWRKGRTPLEQAVYDVGVRTVGVRMIMLAPLIGIAVAFGVASSRVGTPPLLAVIAVAVLALPVAFPFALWGGYLMGWVKAGALGRASHQFREGDDPLPPPI